jgi:GTP-binding protein
VERTKVLVHLIDAYNDDIVVAYKTIQEELKAYKIDMSGKPQLVAINKIDGLDDEIVEDLKAQLQKQGGVSEVFAISANSGSGVQQLLYAVNTIVQKLRAEELLQQAEEAEKLPVITIEKEVEPWKVQLTEDAILVHGEKIERFVAKTDFESEDAVRRLRDIMRKMGITRKIERLDATPGLPIYFGENRTDHLEY